MANPTTTQEQRYLLARFTRANGSSKDWAIAVIDGEVYVRHGKTEASMPRKQLDRKGLPALSDARRRLQEQIDQVYDVLGTCTFDAEGKVGRIDHDRHAEIPVHADQPASARPQGEADIYFEVKSASWQALFAVMEAAYERLSPHYECRWVTRQGVPTGVPKIEGWTLTFDGHNGTGQVRHSGSLRRVNGVGALLFLLTMRHLASDGVEVRVVKADGGEIAKDLRKEESLLSTFESSVELVTAAAEDAGLIPKRIKLSQVDTGQADYWF
ncbi:hypothetical protein [Azospirillum sp. SYSU D00513]|uniref:hypothetical protein n=1 Tax=Azospirillum sp. SYSU D00513 TaxID=2812561 RepID=UPI001A97A200|nr:hypothetical protein [Azospirillum sp. SYSU D00513]